MSTTPYQKNQKNPSKRLPFLTHILPICADCLDLSPDDMPGGFGGVGVLEAAQFRELDIVDLEGRRQSRSVNGGIERTQY